MKLNKTAKIVISAVLCVLCVGFIVLGSIGAKRESGMTASEARNGVVYIESLYYDESGALNGASGTGWAIGEPGKPVEYIITNAHVIQPGYLNNGQLMVYFSAVENDYVIPYVVFYSAPEENDIAILKLPSPTTKRTALTLRDSDTVNVGETAYALGFPGVSNDLEDNLTKTVDDVTVTKGVISKRTPVNTAMFEAFQIDVAVNRGNSGGPLVDENGFVLGVNTLANMVWLDDSTAITQDANYASIADELMKILDDEGINYTVKGDYNWMMFLFYPLALLSLAGAVLLFVTGKENKAGAGAGKAPAYAAPMGSAPAKTRPVIRGISGKYAGQVFEVRGSVNIGRDNATCTVAFPANTPGISAHHCSVLYDSASDKFRLTDTGSSYGTFRGNGRKLTSGAPEMLSAGEMFYLADGANKFVVDKE